MNIHVRWNNRHRLINKHQQPMINNLEVSMLYIFYGQFLIVPMPLVVVRNPTNTQTNVVHQQFLWHQHLLSSKYLICLNLYKLFNFLKYKIDETIIRWYAIELFFVVVLIEIIYFQEEYQNNTGRKTTLVQQSSVNDYNDKMDPSLASQDLWRLRCSLEIEEQQRLERGSPEDFSPDLLTSTSIDSAGAMPIHNSHSNSMATGGGGGDDDPSRYQVRRKSSANLLVPPPEVRRQALRRTFEKRRSCINQSNSRREQQALNKNTDSNNENHSNPITDFSSLLNNFNSKSENSSFERSLETDFDMQSDTSSRGPNDQFTSIESSGNENSTPEGNNRAWINRRTQQSPQLQLQQQQLLQLQQQQQQSQSPQTSPHQDDSGYKSLESQNSQNRTFSLDWMSADGGESVIFVGDGRLQQRSVDVKDLDDDLDDQQTNDQRYTNK